MKNEEKKKSLFGNLFVTKKEKGGCCNIELEEVTEEKSDNVNDSEATKQENNSCCS